jgi:hypothetical protein
MFQKTAKFNPANAHNFDSNFKITDMKRKLLSFGLVLLALFQVTAQEWSLQNSGAPVNSTYRTVAVGSPSYVIAAGATSTNGRLIHYTNDGGANWQDPNPAWINSNLAIRDFHVVSIANGMDYNHHALTNTSYTQANALTNGFGNDGFAGPYNIGTGTVMNRMFIDGSVKILVGKSGQTNLPVVEYTCSTTNNWGCFVNGDYIGTDTWNNVEKVNNNIWIIGNNGKLNRNTEPMASISFIDVATGVSANLYGIDFINENIGFVVGAGGLVLKTTNGGTTWTATYPTTNDLHAVTFVSSTEAWAVGANGTILHTINAGDSWSHFTSPTTQTLYDVAFANPFVGYAVGAGGTIIKFQDNCTNATSFTAISCGPYGWVSQQYNQSGTYTQVFQNQYGCDSTVTLDLTVYPFIPTTEVFVSACESYSFNSQTYTESGQYTHTLISTQYGCDSVVVLNLTILVPPTVNIVNTGLQLFASGDFWEVQWIDCDNNFALIENAISNNFMPSVNGSYGVIVSNNVCPNDTSECILFCMGLNTAVSINGMTISAVQNGASYQWLDCNNGNLPIPGATSQSYTTTAPGSYAVEITLDGCTTVSTCYAVGNSDPVGIMTNEIERLLVYPNPATNVFHIVKGAIGSSLVITDVSGRIIFSGKITNELESISTENWSNGLYLIQTELNGAVQQQKVVVQK